MAITNLMKPGLALAVAMSAATLALPASAAGLAGTLRDTYFPSIQGVSPEVGPCYVRADVGYSLSSDPDVSSGYAGSIQQSSLDNTWLADVGGGCGSGSQGLRADLLFGYHGDRDFTGTARAAIGAPGPNINGPLSTSLKSYTLMFNTYYDFGQIRGFVPYLGAGIGAAYHVVDDISFGGGRIEGNETTSFAWALMAGLGYQVSDRAIFDLGYRYIDMGNAKSGGTANAGQINRQVELDGIAAHEFKVGLRYHFGQSSRCCNYETLK
jgi:opacity protein-like surface antigen